jgi:hypothetical protein
MEKQYDQVQDCRGSSCSFCFGCETCIPPSCNSGARGVRILSSGSRRAERGGAYVRSGIGVDRSSAKSICRDRRWEHRYVQDWEKKLPSRAAGWCFCDPALEQRKPLRSCRKVLMLSADPTARARSMRSSQKILGQHCDALARADPWPPWLWLTEARSGRPPKNLKPGS